MGLPVLVAQEQVAQGQTRSGASQTCTTSSSVPACLRFPGVLLSQVESWAEHSQAPQRLSRSQVHGSNRWSVLSSSEELQMVGKIFLPISKERNN